MCTLKDKCNTYIVYVVYSFDFHKGPLGTKYVFVMVGVHPSFLYSVYVEIRLP